MRNKLRSVLLLVPVTALAHPLGNFSVNHYMKFEITSRGIEMRYVIDLAEIPAFEVLRGWQMDRTAPHEALRRKAEEQTRTWIRDLEISAGGVPVTPRYEGADYVIADGAGNLPILRITARMRLNTKPGKIEYEDHNYDGRAGWKEIVIASRKGARFESASQSDKDRSDALAAYPPDPTLAPPQDLRAQFVWASEAPVAATRKPVIHTIPQPAAKPAPPASTITAKNAAPGSVVRDDFLSRLLHREDIPLSMILIALVASFGLGAAHALTPGHGKTIVAAYLVGSRGTLRHAAFLGAMVTFTHTITVFALGLATLFLFRFIVPEKITETLGAISGMSIVAVGAWMLYKRLHCARSHHHHHHGQDHSHHHGPGGHTHVPEGGMTWGSLTALAVSGGLVPCESALVLLLSAIALGRVGLGLMLLVAFSLGLAVVLMGIGAIVLYAKNLLPDRAKSARSPYFRWVPVASAATVMVVGMLMTGVSLGLLRPGWLAG